MSGNVETVCGDGRGICGGGRGTRARDGRRGAGARGWRASRVSVRGGMDGSRHPSGATTARAAGGRNADADTFAPSMRHPGKRACAGAGRGAHLVLELLKRLTHDAARALRHRDEIPGAVKQSVVTPAPSRSRRDARLAESPSV